MANSLLAELTRIFELEPPIDEMGMIFPLANQRDSPSSKKDNFLVQGRKLGISVHILKSLYVESRDKFNASIRGYKAGDSTLVHEVLSSSCGMLIVNADHATAWNARKLAIQNKHFSLEAELRLLNLVLCKHSKSSHAWAHRSWVWSCIFAQKPLPSFSLSDELDLCTRVAELYPKNYYAWSQRAWVIRRFLKFGYDFGPCERKHGDILACEVKFLLEWMTTHVSDHSATHHCSSMIRLSIAKLMDKKISECTTIESIQNSLNSLFTIEFNQNANLILLYPGHESLWCFRRFLLEAYLSCSLRVLAKQAPVTDADHWSTWILKIYENYKVEEFFVDSEEDDESYIDKYFVETGNKFFETILKETEFALRRALCTSCWDYALQRRHALAYIRFMTSRASLYDQDGPKCEPEDSNCAPELCVPALTQLMKPIENGTTIKGLDILNNMAGDLAESQFGTNEHLSILPVGFPYATQELTFP